jgi:hypothetical protein
VSIFMMAASVFIIPFHVKPAATSIMPANLLGAYVTCYAPNADFEQAARACMSALQADGLLVEEIMQPIHTMEMGQWTLHISEQWPDQANRLPNQTEFEATMNAGKVVYGPFAGYDTPK